MMKSPNTIEDEISATRLKLYEQTKNMTPGEFVAHINSTANEVLKRHGISAVKMVKEKQKNVV
jgi:hypothetical protein